VNRKNRIVAALTAALGAAAIGGGVAVAHAQPPPPRRRRQRWTPLNREKPPNLPKLSTRTTFRRAIRTVRRRRTLPLSPHLPHPDNSDHRTPRWRTRCQRRCLSGDSGSNVVPDVAIVAVVGHLPPKDTVCEGSLRQAQVVLLDKCDSDSCADKERRDADARSKNLPTTATQARTWD